MKLSFKIFAMMATVFLAATARADDLAINGAGATFPYPVYSQWGFKYNQETGVKLNYQSIGSGGGIAQIKAKTVDFGASDAPLKAEELDKDGLMQFPMVIGGVVPVVNLPGIAAGQIKLTPEIFTGMFLGKVTKWNDEAIKKLNPDVALPDKAVTVVHRADGSGTTWIFTNYLATVSEEWKTKVGADKDVAWPVGVGGKGNEGVAAYVQRIAGAVGYVEYAYALQNKMTTALLQNKAGQFVAPTMETFQAAAASADWASAPGYYVILVDQPGENSWPITGASFILVHRDQIDKDRARAVLKFFDWCYKNGTEVATALHYVTLPDSVIALVNQKWTEVIKDANHAAVWP